MNAINASDEAQQSFADSQVRHTLPAKAKPDPVAARLLRWHYDLERAWLLMTDADAEHDRLTTCRGLPETDPSVRAARRKTKSASRAADRLEKAIATAPNTSPVGWAVKLNLLLDHQRMCIDDFDSDDPQWTIVKGMIRDVRRIVPGFRMWALEMQNAAPEFRERLAALS